MHTYTREEARGFNAPDWDDIRQLAAEWGVRVWKHADGTVILASYEELAEYIEKHEGDSGDDWTEVE